MKYHTIRFNKDNAIENNTNLQGDQQCNGEIQKTETKSYMDYSEEEMRYILF